MSWIGKAIDDCIALEFGPLLKKEGYRKKGRTFYRPADGGLRMVHVQAGKFNYVDRGRFTINLGVYFPGVFGIITGLTPPELPSAWQCSIVERIGHFMPPEHRGDKWWDLEERTADLRTPSDEICAVWRGAARTWLDGVATPEGALAHTTGPHQSTRYYQTSVALLLTLGRREVAKQLLLEMLRRAEAEPKPAVCDFIRTWSAKIGLPLT